MYVCSYYPSMHCPIGDARQEGVLLAQQIRFGGGGAKNCTHSLLPKVPPTVAKHDCLEKFPFTQIWEHLLDLEEPLLLNPQYGLSERDTNLNHSAHTVYHHAHVLSYQLLRLEAS
jgi:hypothetical protein